jgi:hypothetical protein
LFFAALCSSAVQGIDARKQEIANFLTSMPDFEFKLIGIAANGDFVATELVGTGTPEGLVAEERYYYDRLTMIQQLNPPS